MDGSFFGIRRGELMGYTFPKGLKIVTEQGENARFAADFLKDEIFFRSGAVIPVENAAQADREAEAGEGEILLQTDSELEEETFTLTRKGDGIKIQAADKRGFLYGVSWVLRKMYLKDRKTGFSEELTDIKIQPSYRMQWTSLGTGQTEYLPCLDRDRIRALYPGSSDLWFQLDRTSAAPDG